MELQETTAMKLLALMPFVHEKIIHPMGQITRSKLSGIQFWALNILSKRGSQTMSELAEHMKIAKQQLTPVVDRLIEQKCVVRSADPQDRRVVRIDITEDGQRMMDVLKKESRDALILKVKNLTESEQLELNSAVDKVREILEKL